MSESELTFVLCDQLASMVRWFSIDPANPGSLRSLASLSLEAQHGNAFNTVASVYHDGGFTVADDRGLHRITSSEITTLVLQERMLPRQIFHFPGASREFIIWGGEAFGLQSQPQQLICSMGYLPSTGWYSWNNGNQKVQRLPIPDYNYYEQAIAEGPVA